MTPQHGGKEGTDTTWARLSPAGVGAPDDRSFAKYGNTLSSALRAIANLTGYKPKDLAELFDA